MALSLDGTTGISASGNITGGNVIASGSLVVGSFAPTSVSTAGNVTGGNILTGGLISSTGNIQGGNIRTVGLVSATGAISGASVVGGVMTGTSISVTGAVSGASASVSGTVTGASVVGGVITGSSVSVSGNVSGGNLNVTGNIVDTGALTIITSSNGNITLSPNGIILALVLMLPVPFGNITLSPNGTGNINTSANIMPTANATANIGSASLSYNTIFAKATSAQYADLAEMYLADSEYTPGTVLDFGGEQEVTATTQSHSTRVAGIVSTHPSYLMNSTLTCANAVEVALVGRVPCHVVGTIAKGDRLVSSSIPGIATRLDMEQYQPGCIVGKALEDYNSETIGTIEVAVGRF